MLLMDLNEQMDALENEKHFQRVASDMTALMGIAVISWWNWQFLECVTRLGEKILIFSHELI